jgi:hypothetical protein
MSTNYKYQDLAPDSGVFRVLDLQRGSEADVIQCLIRTTSVSSPTSYEALSYCWGDQSITKDILVEGYRFPGDYKPLRCPAQLTLEKRGENHVD